MNAHTKVFLNSNIKRIFLFIIIISFTVVIDQMLKYWIVTNMTLGEELPLIKGFLHLKYVNNPGLCFGIDFNLSTYWRICVLFLKIIVLSFLGVWVMKKNRDKFTHNKTHLIIAISFIIGGGFGNCLDWIFFAKIYPAHPELLYNNAPFLWGYGKVVDMFYLPCTYIKIPFRIDSLDIFFPIFNLADVFIVIGVTCFFFYAKKDFKIENKRLECIKSSFAKRGKSSKGRSKGDHNIEIAEKVKSRSGGKRKNTRKK